MNQIFLNVMAASNNDGWSISQFLKKIADFFTSNYWEGNRDVRALVIGLVLFCVVAFIVSGTFLKIVKEEMEKRRRGIRRDCSNKGFKSCVFIKSVISSVR